MKNRGATLVEMLFTMSLMVMTIGVTVTLYAFVVIRAGDSVTQYNTYQQTNDLMKAMSETASNAIKCESVTIGSITALKCTMPNSGTDTDNDGIIDRYQPTGVYKTLQEYYSPGKRIWFFPSTKPLLVGSNGNFWYRAIRNDDTVITSTNVDSKWSYLTGSTPRIYIPGVVGFTHNSASLYSTLEIRVDPDTNPNRQVRGFSGDLALKLPAVTLSRRCYWRGAK